MALDDVHSVMVTSGVNVRPPSGTAWLVIGIAGELSGLELVSGSDTVTLSGTYAQGGRLVLTNDVYLRYKAARTAVSYVEVPGS